MNFIKTASSIRDYSPSIKSSIIIVIALIIFVLVIYKKIKNSNTSKAPSKLIIVCEMFISFVNGMTEELIGSRWKKYAPWVATFGMFVFISNISGLLGFTPPTANIFVTLALGIIAGFIFHITGIKEQGFKEYVKGFISPSPLMLPLNIIGEIVTPISMGIRLFGNIISGVVLMNLIYSAISGISIFGIQIGYLFAPPIAAAFHVVFDIFFGGIQAFVFMLLTIVFISGKLPEEEK